MSEILAFIFFLAIYLVGITGSLWFFNGWNAVWSAGLWTAIFLVWVGYMACNNLMRGK